MSRRFTKASPQRLEKLLCLKAPPKLIANELFMCMENTRRKPPKQITTDELVWQLVAWSFLDRLNAALKECASLKKQIRRIKREAKRKDLLA